ncbi:hypothetical protein ATE67_13750 [Sphingopyxis sp. H050]|uniref:hypothetical protein n=1 Tax=Sphingopyxis sp. H050 TaxID=1759072 RepID=UPI000736ECA8|nr:hypothetical protein [Sphingopyxis sp. H050]KTE19704.1 hypothetical protein ATE67_13750 [Sphingopyxis sp. H050]
MSDGAGAAAAAGGEGEAGGGAAAAGGGAAALLGGQGGEAAAGAGGGGEQAGQGGGEAAAAEWLGIFSDKAAGEGQTASRDWVKSKGFKDPDAMVSSYRELEGKFLSGDKIVLPKEGDGAEVVEAFHKAIGRPDAADGYDLKLGEGEEVNEDLAKVMREAAFKAGVPASMFAAMAEPFNAYMRDVLQNHEAAQVQQREAGVAEYRTEVGDKFNTHIAAGNKAMRLLELSGEDIAGIEQGLGTKKTLALFAKLGMGMGEDILLDAGGRPKFSLSKEEAQAKLDMLGKQEGYLEKLKSDPKLKAEREHLLTIVASAEAREREARG